MNSNNIHSNKYYSLWLLSCLILTLLMIFVGGITRLTNSGLSIVEWNLISGIIPPISDYEWITVFNKYKEFPEYNITNSTITLLEFKKIFFIEYIHRLLGRVTGILYIIPWIIFIILKKVKIFWSSSVAFLIGLQGLMGWYMVKSGLAISPHVSHYRLAIHLIIALAIYGILLWQIFVYYDFRYDDQQNKNRISNHNKKYIYKLRTISLICLIILIFQIFLGGMVAGLKAGLIYNSFPLMNGNFFPDEIYYIESFTCAFSNPGVIQFLHRITAYLLSIVIIYISYILLQIHQYKESFSLILVFVTQFLLGIFTILYHLPIMIALLHQIFAFFLFSVLLKILQRFQIWQ